MTCDMCRLCLETSVADVLNQHTVSPTLSARPKNCLRPAETQIGGSFSLDVQPQNGRLLVVNDFAGSCIRARIHGLADPTINDAVRQVRRGLRRLIGTAPRRQARPLSTTEFRRRLDHLDRTTVKGDRHAALILLGFASAMRRSELAGLDLIDISHRPGGILITIRRSKTDQDGAGQVVGVAQGRHTATDPVAALAAWCRHRGSQPGRVFTSPRTRVAHDPISGEAISRMLRSRARSAGLEATRITGRSLRAGHATEAARAGVPLDQIAAQIRHQRPATLLERYIRPAQALQMTSSRELGL